VVSKIGKGIEGIERARGSSVGVRTNTYTARRGEVGLYDGRGRAAPRHEHRDMKYEVCTGEGLWEGGKVVALVIGTRTRES
jgi:hypothetical protein